MLKKDRGSQLMIFCKDSMKRELRKLQRKRENSARFYQRCIREAKEQKKSEENIKNLVYENMAIDDRYQDGIEDLQHRWLVQEAERLLITTPKDIKNDDPDWKQSELTDRWRFSDAKRDELRREIREEKQFRSEKYFRWIMILTGLITALAGLAGTLIGLITTMPSWFSN